MRASLFQLLQHTYESALDIVFPPSKRLERVRLLTLETLPVAIGQHSLFGRTITSLSSYKDPRIKDAVRVLKYERSHFAAGLLSALLAEFLLEKISEDSLLSDRPFFLVPIPLGDKRKHERGYNQVELILENLSHHGITTPVRLDILERTRETLPQTSLSRKNRLINMVDAFRVRDNAVLSDTSILLIDDVTTTGATLHNAALALEKNGASVTTLALIHA